MSRETASRDVALNALAVLTGGLTAAAIVGTGLVTGLAADATAQKAHAKAESQAKAQSQAAAAFEEAAASQAAEAARRVLLQPVPRPTRTVVTTRIVELAQGQPHGSGGSGSSTQVQYSGRSQAPVRYVAQYRAPAPYQAPAPVRAPAPSAAS